MGITRTTSSRVALAALSILVVLPVGASHASTVFTVNTASDSDASCTPEECSLREAIQAANSLAGKDTIAFAIPGNPPPPIQLVASLPPITDPVVVDGTTQPGYAGAPIVEIDGSLLNEPGRYGDGLTVWASDTLIQGLVINDFEGGYGIGIRSGVLVGGEGGHRIVIQHNYIGTSRDGRSAEGNFFGIAASGSQGTTIGGTEPGQRNVISGNYDGINFGPGSGSGTRVLGNFIGTDPAGTSAVPNTGQAIRLDGSDYTFGGSGAGEGNLISGNEGDAFEIVTDKAFSNVIQGNRIGVDVNGAPLGNKGVGAVFVFDAHDNLLGGSGPGQGNIIANNTYGGVMSYNGSGNQISGNSIHSNTQLGIDLLVSSSGGITPNDASDADQGANDLQNFPVIESASASGLSLTIRGRLRSTPDSAFRIELFDNRVCDPSGNGEGQFFLGSTPVTTDGNGDASFTATVPAPALATHVLTATATNAAGSTSEFSRCLSTAGSGATASPMPSGSSTPRSSPTPGASSSPSPGATSPSPGSTPTPDPTVDPNSADVRVTQSVHHAGRFFGKPGPLLVGNPEIPDELWFQYEIVNEGPAATDVTFRAHPDTFDYRQPGRGKYDFWTVPMQSNGQMYQGGPDDCNSNFVCRIRLRPGRSYLYTIEAEANAPGPFSIRAAAWGKAPDPDTSNNRTEVFDKRVVCSIEGTSKADRLVATDEPDSICGWGGNDHLVAVGNLDKIFGQAGNDVLSGKPGNRQTFHGGDGFDIADFENAKGDVVVALHARTAGGRTAYDVEGAVGSRFGDYMTGLLGSDRLWGGGGNDRIAGRSGKDLAVGGAGNDRFITADGDFDRVNGGPGDDLTQSDSGDRVTSATRTSSPTFYLDPI